MWQDMVLTPLRAAGLPEPELITVKSSYRTIISPLIDVVLQLEERYPQVKIAVILPELVVRRWWEYFLHNQRVQFLKLALLVRGKQRIVVVNIPWYLTGGALDTTGRPAGSSAANDCEFAEGASLDREEVA
jgi:hypothetical protein